MGASSERQAVEQVQISPVLQIRLGPDGLLMARPAARRPEDVLLDVGMGTSSERQAVQQVQTSPVLQIRLGPDGLLMARPVARKPEDVLLDVGMGASSQRQVVQQVQASLVLEVGLGPDGVAVQGCCWRMPPYWRWHDRCGGAGCCPLDGSWRGPEWPCASSREGYVLHVMLVRVCDKESINIGFYNRIETDVLSRLPDHLAPALLVLSPSTPSRLLASTRSCPATSSLRATTCRRPFSVTASPLSADAHSTLLYPLYPPTPIKRYCIPSIRRRPCTVIASPLSARSDLASHPASRLTNRPVVHQCLSRTRNPPRPGS